MIEYMKFKMEDIVEFIEDKCEIAIIVVSWVLEIIISLLLLVTIPIWIIPFYLWRRKKG